MRMTLERGRHSSYVLRKAIDKLVQSRRDPVTLRFDVFNTIERDVCVDHMKRYPDVPYFCTRLVDGRPWDGVEYDSHGEEYLSQFC